VILRWSQPYERADDEFGRLLPKHLLEETYKADKQAFTRNISDTGLFIHTNAVMKPGTTIQVQIQFPDRMVSHWARVVWGKQVPQQLAHVVECGMGIKFIEPTPDWFEYFEDWRKKIEKG
jgi:hypothetical protein